jgi:hypothetical protein
MSDAKQVMKAIVGLIERYLRHEKILPAEFKKVQEMMNTFEVAFNKKNPRARPFDNPIDAWMIHEQPFLAGTPHASGGPPSYFWELIEGECNGGEPVEERHFQHSAALFG